MLNVRDRIANYLNHPNSKLFSDKKEALSYSRLSTVSACPHKHNLKYVKHYKSTKKNSNLFFGQVMHDTLAYWYSMNMQPSLIDVASYWCEQAKGIYEMGETEVEFKKDEDLESMTEYGVKMLKAYFKEHAQYDRENWDVLAVEKPFWIPLLYKDGRIHRKYNLEGIIDLIVRDKNTDETIIIDHKTLSRKMDRDIPPTSQQLSLYYIGAIYGGHKADKAGFNNLYKNKTPKFERLYTSRTNKQLLDFMRNSREVSKAISSNADYKVNSFACGWCDMKELCLKGKKDNVYKAERITLKERIELND